MYLSFSTSDRLFSNPLPGERVAEGRVRGRGFHAVAGEKTRTFPHPPAPLPKERGVFKQFLTSIAMPPDGVLSFAARRRKPPDCVPKPPDCVPKPPDCVPKPPGCVPKPPGCVPKPPGRVPKPPGRVPKPPGCVPADPIAGAPDRIHHPLRTLTSHRSILRQQINIKDHPRHEAHVFRGRR